MDCMFRFVTTFALLGTVAACGGGGGGSKAPSPPPPAPAPTATLTAQTGSMPLQLAWLDETSLTITGSVSWTNLPAGVHVVATDLGNYLGPMKAQQVTVLFQSGIAVDMRVNGRLYARLLLRQKGDVLLE